MDKKDFGLGITTGLKRKFLIRTLVEEDNITLATYETFQYDESSGTPLYVSQCENNWLTESQVTIEEELADLVHNTTPFPTSHLDNILYPGTLFGKDETLYFRLKATVTLNKSFALHGLNPRSLWAINSSITFLMKTDGTLIIPHNKYTYTKEGKQDGQNYILLKGTCGIAQIYLAHPTNSFADDGFRITVNEEVGYYSNLEFDVEVEASATGYGDFADMFYPVLTAPVALECAVDGSVEIPITLTTADGENYDVDENLYLKTNAGYLPLNKVTVTVGVATARFMALGLLTGETATVKIGYKWFENVSSTEITVA